MHRCYSRQLTMPAALNKRFDTAIQFNFKTNEQKLNTYEQLIVNVCYSGRCIYPECIEA